MARGGSGGLQRGWGPGSYMGSETILTFAAPLSLEGLLFVLLSLGASDSLSSKAADHMACYLSCLSSPGLWGC